MILLLDTHAFLWWRMNDPRVETVRRSIAAAQTVFVSSASAWEAAIKQALGKLRLEDAFAAMVHGRGFTQLPRHHRDPFDRMLIAQAQTERAMLVTHDPQFERYDVPLLRL